MAKKQRIYVSLNIRELEGPGGLIILTPEDLSLHGMISFETADSALARVNRLAEIGLRFVSMVGHIQEREFERKLVPTTGIEPV